jgi:mannose-6-phosphate isomerase-like protein (cupin superfamily)
MKKLKRIMLAALIVLFVWFGLVGLIMNHIFPASSETLAQQLTPGYRFSGKQEGFSHSVTKVHNGWVWLRSELAPHAPGPPEHIHESFDETFRVEKGTLSLMLNGKKTELKAGESITIPRGTPHKPFNETNEIVVLYDSTGKAGTMPVEFAAGLSALYIEMDKAGDPKSGSVLLQLAAQGNSFDTWVTEAPGGVQKFMRWMLGPVARLCGYGY